MPTVPIDNGQLAQAAQIPGARLDVPVSGASPVGQALQSAGQNVSAVYQEQRAKAQTTMLADSLTKLKAATIQRQFDPKAGWQTKRGSDSFNLHQEELPQFDTAADNLAASIPDPDVRQAFQQHAADQRVDLTQRLDGWIDQQHKTYDAEVLDNGIKTSQAAAALNWQDPARVQREIADQTAHFSAYASNNGLPPQWVESQVQSSASATHSAVIQQMLTNGQDAGAKAYLEAHKTELSADAQVSLGKAVDYGSTQAQSQVETSRIYDPAKPLEAMEADADKITDQRVQAATKERLRTMVLVHKQAVDEQGKNLLQDGLRVLNTDPRGLDAIPPQTLTQLNQVDPERYQALVATAQRMSRREDLTTDQGNAYFIRLRSALSGAMGEPARNAALAEDTNKLSPMLSKNDLRELNKLQDDARLGKDLTGEHAEESIAAQTLALNGYKPEPLNHDGTANIEAIAFRTALRKQLAADKAAGKRLQPEDIQRTANKLLTPVPTGSGWFGGTTSTPAFMLGVDRSQPGTAVGQGATGAYALTMADFPDETVKGAKQYMRSAGLATDDDSVLRYLRAKAVGGAVKPGSKPPAAPNYQTMDGGF